MIAIRSALLALTLVAVAGAGCGTMQPAPNPPPMPPSTSPCAPGYHPGPSGGCARDESNFGGPPIYLGPQA